MARLTPLLTKGLLLLALVVLMPSDVLAQVGEHRNELSVGVNGGYVMSNVGYVNKIPQSLHKGMTGGLSFRYTSEKYFNSICAVVAEVNFAQIGWKENILDKNDEPVINAETELAEEYQRDMTYIQIPVFARLGWGRERRGLQAFFQVGPQIGFFKSEKTVANFDYSHWRHYNLVDRVSVVSSDYVDQQGRQIGSNVYNMPVENKVDYGIAAALGIEFLQPKLGHFLLEGRYYYGLGDIYGNSKRDYFSRSNFSNIIVKLSYLFDITKTKNHKIR